MEKNITVKDFCAKMQDENFDVSEYINTEYVSFADLVNRSKLIVDNSYHVTVDGKQHILFNSVAEYLFYSLSLVDLYTTIDVDFSNAVAEFDMLRGTGVLDWIVSNIDEDDRKEFRLILEMTKSDFINNEREIHSYINSKVTELATAIGSVLAPILDKIDTDKIVNVIKTMK